MDDIDSDSDIEEYSSMEQPPLIKQLKTILAEYPDDGQIIKELLQNAEDAGASEVKILYDDRCINAQEDKRNRYQKFLRGPALCFFNDATFTESDWKGIKMIYSSVKEEDPLKVGRFGLGFKSVFHITDNPVVLSGDRIMFMDPHRTPDCVCLTIQLSKLMKWKKINIEDFFLALDGTFGVSREILKMGFYKGTLFWFPLRSEASKLSDTLYNRDKVMDLFTSFRSEASSILVFLKHLTKVSLHQRKGNTDKINLQFTVDIVNNIDEVRELREAFLKKIRNLNKSIPNNSFDCRYHLSFCTKSFDGDRVVEENKNAWKVIHYYKGESMSEELRLLIQDHSLGYSPFVGVATPIGQNHTEFKGHVYCFLPLPQKIKSMTGLPVHVNGFFALSQNRRHIKWPSAEQAAMHLHKDKSLMWNEKLLKEVLPEAYEILITELITHSVKNGNPDDIVQCVYAAIPRFDQVLEEWNALLPSLFGRIISRPTLMTVNISGQKSWISCSEAYFATFRQYTNLAPTIKPAVVKVLQMYDKRYVDVPLHLFESYSKFNSRLTDMSPQSFAAVLKEGPKYKSLSREEKLSVLEFLTLDCHYEILEGLELLPLQDGSFVTFVSRHITSDRVLLCSKEEMGLFPGLEKTFVYHAGQSHWIMKHMQAIVRQGFFQIQLMEAVTFRTLLERTIQMHLGSTSPPTVRLLNKLSGNWIQKVWEHIFSHNYGVENFSHVPLIPLLKSGLWSNPAEMELYQLTNFLIVKQIQNVSSLNEGVYRCLELLSIHVLPSLPVWLQVPQIFQYIPYSTITGILQLLDKLYTSVQRENMISCFNSSCEEGAKKEFVSILAGCTSWSSNSKNFVRRLKLFMEKGSVSRPVSIQENTTVTRVANFPVKFPRPLITGSYGEQCLAFALGATELDLKCLVMETLQMMQGTTYSLSEKQTFIQYFMQNIREFEYDSNILNMTKEVYFLESNIMHAVCRPADLFDPLDTRLGELFYGEDRFPAENRFRTNTDIEILKKLGLKSYSDLSAIELYDVARRIESWSESEKERNQMHAKVNRFLEVLKGKPLLLNAYIHGHMLKAKLMNMKCMMHEKKKDQRFPSVLPWFQQQHMLNKPSELRLIKFSTLVGSTMPLIDCQSKELAEAFGWNLDPPQNKVVEQLQLLINIYESSYKPELLPIMKEIYQELCKYSTYNLLADANFQTLLQKGCIWRGDGFSSPHNIFLESKGNDLDLSPYLYKLPEEFKGLHSFFLGLGCNKEQNADVFLKTQVLIKGKYASGKHSNVDVRRDLSILISILNRLRQDKSKLQDRLHEILFPIHCSDESVLILKQGSECTYCDAQWLREMAAEETDEENIYYVHEDVSNTTAEELGVRSLTQQLLSDTEELVMEEWGQEEPLTTRLQRLLKEGYQDGFSVPKEIVQNADDAGAKCVYFLYDERENEDAKFNLLDEGMAECQGTALWAYNDAYFRTEDFKNITRLNAATKKDELEKIGKFGLGFCSVYNLTDVPSFISGRNIVILDPHKTHLGKALPGLSPGMKIDFGKMKNLRMMKRLKNQFKPFQNVFGCNISCDFQGTLFRFPLRTASQAQKSEICNKYYSKKECLDLLDMTIKAAGNLLLFTQHIQEIKIFHIPADCKNPEEAKLIYSMTKEHCQGQTQGLNQGTVMSQVSKLKTVGELRSHPFKRLQKIIIRENIDQYARSILPSLGKEAGMSVNSSWLIAWATGTDEALKNTFRDVVGALPLCAVAVPFELENNYFCPLQLEDLPFGFYKDGHLFCFLPLPISCGLPVHINGCFAVTSDRRQLMRSTEDDKKAQCSSWNEALIQDALVNAYIYLLEEIRENNPSPEYEYYALWPLNCPETVLSIRKYFFRKLVQLESRLFHRDVVWQSFSKCIFLDPTLRKDKEIGNIAFETLLTFHSAENSVVMELSDPVMKNLETYYPNELKNKIISKEQFVLDIFLPNIGNNFWIQSETNVHKRDKLTMYALEFENDVVKASLSNTKCIPSKPSGALKRPTELVNPLGSLHDMFSDNDEVFPQGKETFGQKKIIERLLILGMINNYMPFSFLDDRCQSVKKIAEICGECAVERCSKILKYLSGNNVQEKLKKTPDDLQKLINLAFLPVLQKPPHWIFSWKGNAEEQTIAKTCEKNHHPNTIRLETPLNLFRRCACNLVGCVELILDETSITAFESSIRYFDVCELLRLKGSKTNEVPYENVVRQLKTVAQEYKSKQSKDTINNCKVIMDEIYSFLDRQCVESDEITQACFREFSNEEVILLGEQMLDASRVSFNLRHNCSPVLFSLHNTDLAKYKHFLKAIGIQDNFEINRIVRVLEDKRMQCGTNPLSIEDIDLVHGLLSVLQDLMRGKTVQYTGLDDDLRRNIVAPDTDSILRETSSLCLDDSEFQAGPGMKTIHAKFSQELAKALGVKTKRRKCFDKISVLIPGGQKEKLVTRLRGILSAYPCDDGIMRELLQNADDARASEIHFIKDYRTHSCEKIFDEQYAPLQGPALCVFNNSAFTKADIEGIHDLGVGSKRDDALKTGQYGVGFNAVYHLTDAPSFLTKGPELEDGEMCIFDPMCQYIPSVTEQNPGVRCLVGDIRKYYPDILKGYLEEGLFTSDVGTMFRFPLRNKNTPKEMFVSPKRIDEEEVNITLKKFCNESFEALLFVKHVSKIIVSNMTSGELKEEYKVEAKLSEDDRKKRDEFFQFVKRMSDQYKQDRTSIMNMPSREVAYTMTVSDSRGASESFYVVQRMGFEDGFIVPQTVEQALKENNLGQLPLGGVAFVISKNQTLSKCKEHTNYLTVREEKCIIEKHNESGRAFCFLPLPLRTGLPCHINGHFVLDHEARRSLWKDDPRYRQDWNYCIFESIVSPAYVSALQYLKQTLFDGLSMYSESIVRQLLDGFLSYFPLMNVAKEDDWKAIVRFVYIRLYSKEVQVFPIMQQKEIVRTQNTGPVEVSIDWTALQMPGYVFPAYFDHLDLRVSHILKRLGMKIIEVPEIIRKSIEESGIETKSVNPSSVLSFVKSFNMSGLGICNLKANVPLTETTFASISIVRSVINYIANLDNVDTEIENSPLLVTNDGVLRTYSNKRHIICSSFLDLLPSSSEHFVHAELLSCQSQGIWKSGILLNLDVHNFLDLLPSSLTPQVFRIGQDVTCQKASNQIPNKNWILRFWQFICDLSVKSTQYGTRTFDLETVKINLEMLHQWSLLPVQDRNETFILRPLSKAFTIIDLWSFDALSELRNALEKLGLPKLDTVIFTEENRMDILRIIRSLVATNTDPIEFLNCLYYHRIQIRNSGLTPEECNAILVFFSKNITKLRQQADESWIRDRIKALPLHITQQDTSTSLEENEKVFTLPTSMPAEGLDEWAANTGYILLRQNKDLTELHNLLQCTFANETHVYCSMVLPRFEALPKCAHLQHLLYIKGTLLHRTDLQTNFDQNQQLINVLQTTPFVEAGDQMKLASEFYDPFQKVLAYMCDKNDFPPSPFDDLSWNEFMKLAGLKTNVSENMFLEFAETLAREGANCISENVCKKSKVLVNFLWDSSPTSWGSKTVERLAKVKFIKPHYVTSELSSRYKQYSESLICFSQSTPAHFELLCWTSMNLLPRWACPKPKTWEQILQKLGVHLRPPVERVVLHCQNLCDAQNKIFSRKDNQASDISFFSNLLERVYVYLSEHRDEDPRMKEKLSNTPVVFLPNNLLLLPAKHIVVELTKEEAVEPYLYKSPDFYGRYNDFFIFLGASQQVSLNHYCLVLRSVYQIQSDNDEKLLPQEMRIVGKAIRNIVNLITNRPDTKIDLDEKILYLPNRLQRLMDARSLIVSDNEYLESRLSEHNLTYFIGFKQLEVKVKDLWQVIKKLPDCYRPKLLSKVVIEEVDTTEMKEINSAEAEFLERFLHSGEFIQGILRLVKHEKNRHGETFTSEDENKMYSQIQGLKIKEVQGLYTYLKINGDRIESSKRTETSFINETMNGHIRVFTLYFQVEEGRERDIQKVLIAKPNGIIKLIKLCTDKSIRKYVEIVCAILSCMQESYNINNTLDSLFIDPYDLHQNINCSIFPRPGTYVPKEYYAFLQQGFSEFQEHEYESVAFELEDGTDGSDTDDAVYIYVRIINQVKSKEPCKAGIKNQYVIDIGDRDKGLVTVYAYKLFKFERKLTSSSQDLLLSNCLPVGSLPFDDISNQIRNILQEAWTLPKEERRPVLKRLLLRWHPDKNIGQEEYCNQIFNYIQAVVSRLDSGQSLDSENISHMSSDGRGVFTGTDYENLGRRVNKTSAQYRMQHDLHADTYYDAHSRRSYAGQSSRPGFPVPDQSNALRWLRQAKKDISSAKEFLPPANTVPAFNWICYHCHQATEKALKAAVYATDANKVDLKSHQLAQIASRGSLGLDLVSLAMSMEASLGHHTRMRYPDSIDRAQIPAEVYADTQARTAIEIAEKVIQLVDENYLN